MIMIRGIDNQNGFSLVELMVTLVVSLVAILSMLSLFQGISRNSTEAKVGARLDGQVQLGLLTAHKLLQGAGYGTGGSYGTDLQLINGATLDEATGTLTGTLVSSTNLTAGTAWALLWRSNGTLAGLHAPATGGLVMLSTSGTATPLTGANNNWAAGTTLIAAPSVTSDNLATSGQVGITVASTNCQPPGLPAGGINNGAFTVTLTANGYAAGATQTATTCLINF